MADAFENILGQPQVREFLRATVAQGKVSHAYLFTGPAGSNKTMAAYAFAQAVLCPKGASGPRGGNCGACDACRRIMRKKHPDVRYFAPEGAGGYLVEQIRDIVADTSMAPSRRTRRSTSSIASTCWACRPPTRSSRRWRNRRRTWC